MQTEIPNQHLTPEWARLMLANVLGAWASDALELRRLGLDIPGRRSPRRKASTRAGEAWFGYPASETELLRLWRPARRAA
ncbi:hypothetical protein PHYC_00444 [Phycisphaerales bacterium]|nr:hypothetical protein PHYC_00444 [Phycisphaerales bacterium]